MFQVHGFFQVPGNEAKEESASKMFMHAGLPCELYNDNEPHICN